MEVWQEEVVDVDQYVPSEYYRKEVRNFLAKCRSRNVLYVTVLEVLAKGYWIEGVQDLDLFEEGRFAFFEGCLGGGLYRCLHSNPHNWSTPTTYDHIMTIPYAGPWRSEREIKRILDIMVERELWRWPDKSL